MRHPLYLQIADKLPGMREGGSYVPGPPKALPGAPRGIEGARPTPSCAEADAEPAEPEPPSPGSSKVAFFGSGEAFKGPNGPR